MSEALIWHLIRDNNSFLVRRQRTPRSGEVQFSREKGNLLNVNTFKYSGLANRHTVHVGVAGDKGKKNVVVEQKTKDLTKPAKSVTAPKVKNAAALNEITASYRGDLTAAAKIRYNKLYKAAKRPTHPRKVFSRGTR